MAKTKKHESSSDSDSSDSSSSEEIQKKQTTKSKAVTPSKKDAKKSKKKEPSSSSDSSSSEEKPVKKTTPKKSKKKAESSSDSSSSEEKPAKKSTPKKSKKKVESSSESSSSSEEAPKKTKKSKKEASSSSDSDSDASSSDAEPAKKTNEKKRKAESSSDSDDESDEKPAAKKAKTETGSVATATKQSEGAGEGARLFLGNLSFKIDDDAIRAFFKDVGELTDIHWVTDKTTGKFYGTGFVGFATAEEAKAAVALNGSDVMGRPIRIDFAQAKGERTPRAGAAGGQRDQRGPTPKPDGCTTVFLGNLSFQIDENAVRSHFGDCGEITSVRWVERDGQFKGCGFLEFSDTSATDKAVALNGSDLMGRSVRVDFSAPRPPRQF